MIVRRTVLVLGAGASCSYGFPTGHQLVRNAISVLRPDSDDTAKRDLIRSGFFRDRLEAFAENLANSHCTSIDAFVESRPNYLDIGRTVIAVLLAPWENPAILERESDDDWFGYLFNLLRGASPEQFQTNQVSVVTFNYDRLFEFALHRALKANYELPDTAIQELCGTIPVVHVHGSLATLPAYRTASTPDDRVRAFSGALASHEYRSIAQGIRIVTEADSTSEEFQTARDQIAQAERVFFLGFGYGRENLRRLGLIENRELPLNKFTGSAHGLTREERKRLGCHVIAFDEENRRCREFLRHIRIA